MTAKTASVLPCTYRIRLRISTARRIFLVLFDGPKDVLSNCLFLWGSRPTKTWFLHPIRVHTLNGTSIGSTVRLLYDGCDQQTNTHTHRDHGTSVTIGRILCFAQRCGPIIIAKQLVSTYHDDDFCEARVPMLCSCCL